MAISFDLKLLFMFIKFYQNIYSPHIVINPTNGMCININ